MFWERIVKFSKKCCFLQRNHVFFANIIGLATSNIAQFEHILVFRKMKVVTYLYK